MADTPCPFGCPGTLGPETRACVETRQRQCARCGAVARQRDDCPHAAELARVRSTAEINAGLAALDRAERAAERDRLAFDLGTALALLARLAAQGCGMQGAPCHCVACDARRWLAHRAQWVDDGAPAGAEERR